MGITISNKRSSVLWPHHSNRKAISIQWFRCWYPNASYTVRDIWH